jgi:hypothetical protein
MRWWKTEACSTRVHAETRYQLWRNIPSWYMWIKFWYYCYWQLQMNYSCSWWIHRHMDHSFWIPILNSLQGLNPKENRNIYLRKSSIVTLWLEEIVEKITWYNGPREFLFQKDYSNNDDCLHVVINKFLIGLYMTFVHVDDFIIKLYTIHERFLQSSYDGDLD